MSMGEMLSRIECSNTKLAEQIKSDLSSRMSIQEKGVATIIESIHSLKAENEQRDKKVDELFTCVAEMQNDIEAHRAELHNISNSHRLGAKFSNFPTLTP